MIYSPPVLLLVNFEKNLDNLTYIFKCKILQKEYDRRSFFKHSREKVKKYQGQPCLIAIFAFRPVTQQPPLPR